MTRRITFTIAALVTAFAGATALATGESTTPLKGDVLGSFFFHACPAEAPVSALCLHDDVTGTLTHLGKTTGSFEVVFNVAEFDNEGCGPIRKEGNFAAANGDRLYFEAEGTFCFSTQVATYQFRVTGGTGRFGGSSGSGSWVVPAPATFNGVAGTGDEFLDGIFVR